MDPNDPLGDGLNYTYYSTLSRELPAGNERPRDFLALAAIALALLAAIVLSNC